MTNRRKICIFTGSRSEYGMLKPLLEEIRSDPVLELQLIVSGSHLSPEFGQTYKEIEEDGFTAAEKVEILLSSATAVGAAKSVGLGLISFAEALARLSPQAVVILGDRFESLAMAAASLLSGIPIAHIAGGEATFGSFDESIRHAVTKMSYLHFTAMPEYSKRVIQLGEAPDRVFCVGSLAVDAMARLTLLERPELEAELNFKLGEENFLVIFHPPTLDERPAAAQMQTLLEVLADCRETKLIFVKSNADPPGAELNKAIESFAARHAGRSVVFSSLEQRTYFSLLREVDAIVGNSSSGIIEAPSLDTAAVNIGSRQEGRIRAGNVVDCEPNAPAIREALARIRTAEFRRALGGAGNPYGRGCAAPAIKDILKSFRLPALCKKEFYECQGGGGAAESTCGQS